MSLQSRKKSLLRAVRIRFEAETGEIIEDDSRLRAFVESRAAIGNALRPYTTLSQIGDLFNKDHSTFVHHSKQHDSLLLYSPEYRSKYELANSIVKDMAETLGIPPSISKYATMTNHDYVEGLRSTIKSLQALEKKLTENLANVNGET